MVDWSITDNGVMFVRLRTMNIDPHLDDLCKEEARKNPAVLFGISMSGAI